MNAAGGGALGHPDGDVAGRLFLASVPIAFAAGSGIAVVVWFLVIPFSIVASRYKPARADEFAMG